MPTGYTAAVKDGAVTALPEFAMGCARAFGALIMMRDEPADAPIPEFQPSDFNAKALEAAIARQAALKEMDPSACEEAALKAYNAQCTSRASEIRERTADRERYESMLEQVKGWEPPTNDHQRFKAFMVEQLQESIKFDCGEYPMSELVHLTGAQWLAGELQHAQRDIDYHKKAHAEEVERTNGRNAWVKALRESLVSA